MPRINFFSFTFLFAFGLGSFVGIGMALLAVALARPQDTTTVIEATEVAVVSTATPTSSPTQEPTETPTPVPVVRTLTTLQVHIGPADDYAVLGTLASGSKIELQGRDDSGDWVAIQFPPQSNARGWIPRAGLQGATLAKVLDLDVLAATIIDTTPDYPSATNTPTTFEGNDSFPTETPGTIPTSTATERGTPTRTPVPGTATQRPFATPTTPPVDYGATDLAFAGASVNVLVQNLGPGDVPQVQVVVNAPGLAPELMTGGLLRAGDSATFRTTSVHLTGTTNLSITVDPNGQLTDSNRANNTRTATLSP